LLHSCLWKYSEGQEVCQQVCTSKFLLCDSFVVFHNSNMCLVDCIMKRYFYVFDILVGLQVLQVRPIVHQVLAIFVWEFMEFVSGDHNCHILEYVNKFVQYYYVPPWRKNPSW
jgi:hypothetical protein